eukprot:Lithocolla_globosa_v1_NODE_5809_length_1180_cov_11.515556.p1 type:complete len:231 gc:universal NODE_5809_length_1180_cov_11.515556:999-307(-)
MYHGGSQESNKLRDAVTAGNLEKVKRLVEKNNQLQLQIQNYDSKNGFSTLHYAVQANQIEIVDYLLASFHEDSEISRDVNGNTPISLAIQHGHMEVFNLLLTKCPQSVKMENSDGWALLHFTARYGRSEVAEILIDKGENIDALDKEGNTPLHYAAAFGYFKLVVLLIDRGALFNEKNNAGWTPRDWSYSNKLDEYLQDTARKRFEAQKEKKKKLRSEQKEQDASNDDDE